MLTVRLDVTYIHCMFTVCSPFICCYIYKGGHNIRNTPDFPPWHKIEHYQLHSLVLCILFGCQLFLLFCPPPVWLYCSGEVVTVRMNLTANCSAKSLNSLPCVCFYAPPNENDWRVLFARFVFKEHYFITYTLPWCEQISQIGLCCNILCPFDIKKDRRLCKRMLR